MMSIENRASAMLVIGKRNRQSGCFAAIEKLGKGELL